MYVTCERDGNFCINPYHATVKEEEPNKRLRYKNGACKRGIAFKGAPTTKQCALCVVLVPINFGYRLNARVLDAFGAEVVRFPFVKHHFKEKYGDLLGQAKLHEDPFICDGCAGNLLDAINHTDKDTSGKVMCWDEYLPFLLTVDERDYQDKSPEIRAFAQDFADGKIIEPSRGDRIKGTACAIWHNEPEICQCSKVSDWTQMRYQKRVEGSYEHAAPYGERCAKIIEEGGFTLHTDYRAFVQGRVKLARERDAQAQPVDHTEVQLNFGREQTQRERSRKTQSTSSDSDREDSAAA